MKIELDAEEDKGAKRLIFSDELWKLLDLEVCVHGEKLRWTCDKCEEHFAQSFSQIPAAAFKSTVIWDGGLSGNDR